MEDRLIIGYDKSDGKDHTCLTVGRQAPGTRGMMILNQYFDKEAEEMYKKLTNKEERTSMNKENCNTCMSRVICPTRDSTGCMGHNDERCFVGLLKLSFGYTLDVDKILKKIKEIQESK